MKSIQRILIANRGEIAVRIIRSLRRMAIESVVAYTSADEDSLFVELADIAHPFNSDQLAESYLNIDQLISIAKKFQVDAIHPGYGFLSENDEFARACTEHDIIFIGPPVEAIALMGDKVASRRFAELHGVPLLKGITGSKQELINQKDKIEYPAIIKASAGGGGKGMRIIRTEDELEHALEATAREAKSYFGNDEVFIERYIENPRHIEVQILADQEGNFVHLYERECTIQRRHQKILEEAPSSSINEKQRTKITDAALQLAKASNYYSLGTVEFIVDEELNFYFMEMNTRIQVEHPVTELILDLDLVEQQIRVAEGKSLPFTQEEIVANGHAIECRIYAEDPSNQFRPSPGTITFYHQPEENEAIRIDTSLTEAKVISDQFDPMISKVITWGENRNQAIDIMQYALDDYIIRGIPTNIDYLQAILSDQNFETNQITTNYCAQFTDTLLDHRAKELNEINQNYAVIAGLLYDVQFPSLTDQNASIWQQVGLYRKPNKLPVSINENEFEVECSDWQVTEKKISINNHQFFAKILGQQEDGFWFMVNEHEEYAKIFRLNSSKLIIIYEGFQLLWQRMDVLDEDANYDLSISDSQEKDKIYSPIPGTVIKLIKKNGEHVKQGESVLIVEAMKMENELKAAQSGMVRELSVNEGDKVQAGQIVARIEVQKEKEHE